MGRDGGRARAARSSEDGLKRSIQSDHNSYARDGREPVFGGKGRQGSCRQVWNDNPAIALLAVVGGKAPAQVTINEFTTIASVWTHNQFIDGTSIKGHALGLRIAAGNVPNFVDLETGGYGVMIQDDLNSTQTPTMANFATLANVMAGCTTPREGRCLQYLLRRCDRAGRQGADRYTHCCDLNRA